MIYHISHQRLCFDEVWCKREKYLIRQSFTPWTCKILIYVDQHCFRHLHKCPHQHHHNLNDVHPCFPRHHDDDCQDGHGHDEDDHLISPPLPGESLVVHRIPICPNEYRLPVPKGSWPENLKIFSWPWRNFSCSMDSNMDSKPFFAPFGNGENSYLISQSRLQPSGQKNSIWWTADDGTKLSKKFSPLVFRKGLTVWAEVAVEHISWVVPTRPITSAYAECVLDGLLGVSLSRSYQAVKLSFYPEKSSQVFANIRKSAAFDRVFPRPQCILGPSYSRMDSIVAPYEWENLCFCFRKILHGCLYFKDWKNKNLSFYINIKDNNQNILHVCLTFKDWKDKHRLGNLSWFSPKWIITVDHHHLRWRGGGG